MQYQKTSKKAIPCMYIGSFIGIVILNAILFAVLQIIPFKNVYLTAAWWVILGLSILECLISPHFRYQRYRFCIDDESIDVVRGFISITRSIVPIERLHNIEIKKGPIKRIFGLSDVEVSTAGSKVSIDYLSDEIAEEIAKRLMNKINTVALVEKQRTVQEEQHVQDTKEEAH